MSYELFEVARGNGTAFVLVLDPAKTQIIMFPSKLKLWLYMGRNIDPKANIKRWERMLMPEFLEFAKTHPVLKGVVSWDDIFGKIH